MIRLLFSKTFYIILLLIIGIILVFLKLNGKILNTNNISIDFFVVGNPQNVGCLSVYVNDNNEGNEYSFDNGNTWQKSKYGAIYTNGARTIMARNKNKEIFFEKEININSIVNGGPAIQLNFDSNINNKNEDELLKGVKATYFGHDASSNIITGILNDKDNRLLVSYLIQKNGIMCYLIKEAGNNNKKVVISSNDKWVWPTNKPYKISRGLSKYHNGVDIYGLNRGSSVFSAHDGEVVEINSNSSSGFYVVIKHNNGYYTRYAHLQNTDGNDKLSGTNSATKYINVGKIVKAGQVIGELGSSGNSTGLHLHFEVWNGQPFKGKRLDPLSLYK